MQSKTATVEHYIDEIPEDHRLAIGSMGVDEFVALVKRVHGARKKSRK